MRNEAGIWVIVLAALAQPACDVESTSSDTGGVGDDAEGNAGTGSGKDSDEGAAGAPADPSGGEGGTRPEESPLADCPQGTTVLLSDWVSSQVALSDPEGVTRSESFFSTASSTTSGLAFALSGDVVLPTSRVASGRVVLLDRFGTNAITWLEPKTGEVLGQLAVGTGFESNPADYVEVSGRTAWVTRWGQNADPGQVDYDEGGDILILDTEEFTIEGNIVIEPEEQLPPRPAAMTLVGDEVVVALERVSEDYTEWGEARLVGLSVSDREVHWELELEGLKNCRSPVPFPDGSRWLVACSGVMTFEGQVEDPAESALVVLDPRASPPVEVERYQAEDIAGDLIQPDVVFASDTVVLLRTQTAPGGPENNRWLSYDLESGEPSTLIEAPRDTDGLGQGLVYGDMICAPGCTDVCLLADAAEGVLQRVRVDSVGQVELIDPIVVEDQVGLPPVGLSYR